MKKLLSMMLVLTFLILLPVNTNAKRNDIIPNNEKGIPDKTLYSIILKTLNKKSGTFTEAEAARITTLRS